MEGGWREGEKEEAEEGAVADAMPKASVVRGCVSVDSPRDCSWPLTLSLWLVGLANHAPRTDYLRKEG